MAELVNREKENDIIRQIVNNKQLGTKNRELINERIGSNTLLISNRLNRTLLKQLIIIKPREKAVLIIARRLI